MGRFSYLECRDCSMVTLQSDQRTSPAEIYTADYFEAGAQSGYTNYAADEPIHRLNARRHLERMTRNGIRPPGVLLDIGCAAGFFMHEASARGWTVVGVDVSPWSRTYARKRFGLKVLESIDEARKDLPDGYDVVTAFQVLEHLPDLNQALRSLRLALKPDGWLCVETWDRSSRIARATGKGWQQLSPPSVVHLFDTTSMRRLLRESGFIEAPLKPMNKFLSVAWAAGLLGSKLGSRHLAGFADSALLRTLPLPYFMDDLVYLATRRRTRRRSSGPGNSANERRKAVQPPPLPTATPSRPF